MSDQLPRHSGARGQANRGGRGSWGGRRSGGLPNRFGGGSHFQGGPREYGQALPGGGQMPHFAGAPPLMHVPQPTNGGPGTAGFPHPYMVPDQGYAGYGQPGYDGYNQQQQLGQHAWHGHVPEGEWQGQYMQYGVGEGVQNAATGQGYPAWPAGQPPWINHDAGTAPPDPSSPSPPPPPPPDEDDAQPLQDAKPLPPWLQNGGTSSGPSHVNGMQQDSQPGPAAEPAQAGPGSAEPDLSRDQAAEAGAAVAALTPIHQVIPTAGNTVTPPSAEPSSKAPTPVKFQMKKPVTLLANPKLIRGLPIRLPAKNALITEGAPEKASLAAAEGSEEAGASKRKSSRWGEEVRKEKKTRWGRDKTGQTPADPSSPQDPASPGAELGTQSEEKPAATGVEVEPKQTRLEKWRQKNPPPPAAATTTTERQDERRRSSSRSSSSSSSGGSGSDTSSSSSGRYRTPPPAPLREASARRDASPVDRYDARGFMRRLERDSRPRRSPSRSPYRDRYRGRSARRRQDYSPEYSPRYGRGSRRETYRRSPYGDERREGGTHRRHARQSRSPIRRSRRSPIPPHRVAKASLAEAAQPGKSRLRDGAPEEGEVPDAVAVASQEEGEADVDMEVEPLDTEERLDSSSLYDMPKHSAPPVSNAARLKLQDDFVNLNRELKARIAGIYSQHGLDMSPSQQSIQQLQDAWSSVRASLFLMDQRTNYENVVLTFDMDSADERSEVSDDIACLGDPSVWGFPSWLPPPLASLDHAPPIVEASPWNPLEHEVKVPFMAIDDTDTADPRPYALVAERQGGASPPHLQLLPLPPFALAQSEKQAEPEGPEESWSTSPKADTWDDAISGRGAAVAAQDWGHAAAQAVAAEHPRWHASQLPPQAVPLGPASAAAQLSAPAPPPLHLAPAHLKHPEPEQGRDWNLIGKEGVLDVSEEEDWQSLAYWRKRAFAGNSSRAIPGACAHRSADNLWLPLTEANIRSSDLEWQGKGHVPESRLFAGKAPGADLPLDEGCKLTIALSDTALHTWLDAAAVEAERKAPSLELPADSTAEVRPMEAEPSDAASTDDAVMAWFESISPAAVLRARHDTWEKEAAETAQSLHRREAEQASNRVWGPPPPPQVPAMLRGRLALRVLGGVEGNTLVAQIIEEAFERVMAQQPERIAAKKAREAEQQRQAAEERAARELTQQRQAEERAAQKRATQELARRNLQAKREAVEKEAKREREQREEEARRRADERTESRRRVREPEYSAKELADIERRHEKRRREDEASGHDGHRKEARQGERRDGDRRRDAERERDIRKAAGPSREGSMHRDDGRRRENESDRRHRTGSMQRHEGQRREGSAQRDDSGRQRDVSARRDAGRRRDGRDGAHDRPEGGHRSRQPTPEALRSGCREQHMLAQSHEESATEKPFSAPAPTTVSAQPDSSNVPRATDPRATDPIPCEADAKQEGAMQQGAEELGPSGQLQLPDAAAPSPAGLDHVRPSRENDDVHEERGEPQNKEEHVGHRDGEAHSGMPGPRAEVQKEAALTGIAVGNDNQQEAAGTEPKPQQEGGFGGEPVEAAGGKSVDEVRSRGRRKQEEEEEDDALRSAPASRAPQPRAPEPLEEDEAESDEDYAPAKTGKRNKPAARARGRGRGRSGLVRQRSHSQGAAAQDADTSAKLASSAAEDPEGNGREDSDTDEAQARAAEEELQRKIMAALVPKELTEMWRLLRNFDREECDGLFADPVDEEEAPNYYSIIKQPMDFKTLGKKVKKLPPDMGGLEALKADVDLIVQNCLTFNGGHGENDYTAWAKKLQRKAEEVFHAAKARIASATYIHKRR